MKQVLLFFAVLFVVTGAIAQPVLHAADLNPVAGDKAISQAAKLKGVKIPNTGAGITWNYSTSLKDSTSVKPDTTTFRAATGTPYISFFKGSNLASVTTSDAGAYSYYKTSTKLLDFYGEASKTDTLVWNAPYRIGIFPITYGTNFTDTSTVTVKEGQTIVEGYRDSTDVVGYGTLKLPGARTFHSVIMVRVISKTTFTILGHTSVSRNVSYNFYASGYHSPLLSIDLSGTAAIDAVSYSKNAVAALEGGSTGDETVTKVAVNTKPAVTIYPNPAVSSFSVNVGEKNKTVSSIVITDMSGKNVFEKKTNNTVSEMISCTSLKAGIYFVRIQMNDGTAEVQKLVVAK
jgi:hypothetical protein